MEKTAFIVRPMRVSDVEDAMKLSVGEGWNQTEKDWKLFVRNPENICIVAEYDGKVIATTTVINYTNQIAWIGMVLVDKNYRGQGISKSLLTTIFESLQAYVSIKLDATPAGQLVYKKFDFKDEYLIARLTNSSVQQLSSSGDNETTIKPIQSKHIPEIIAFDVMVFGAKRTQLINFLVSEYPGKAILLKRNNRITGFALGRNGNKYQQVGPVVASGLADAKILIENALNKLTDKAVVVDVLCDKEELLVWLNSIGFIMQRQFIRMYKKDNKRPGITSNQYLIAGPEYG